MTLKPPELQHVCDVAVTIDAPVEVGQTAMGLRRMIPITGGTVTGPDEWKNCARWRRLSIDSG